MMKKPTIAILTGAGISAESGLATFRDSNGLWANHRIEDVCTLEAWERNPQLVLDFYNQRRAQAAAAQNAYRRYRQIQHNKKLRDLARAAVNETLLADYQAVKTLWAAVFGEAV